MPQDYSSFASRLKTSKQLFNRKKFRTTQVFEDISRANFLDANEINAQKITITRQLQSLEGGFNESLAKKGIGAKVTGCGKGIVLEINDMALDELEFWVNQAIKYRQSLTNQLIELCCRNHTAPCSI